jgi:hypothetical protein
LASIFDLEINTEKNLWAIHGTKKLLPAAVRVRSLGVADGKRDLMLFVRSHGLF